MEITRLTLLIPLLFTGAVQADNWSVGAGLAVEKYAYRDYDSKILPTPWVAYESERFFIDGPSAGIYMINNKTHQLSANAYYSPLSFAPSDSGNWALKQLDKRSATAMAGIGYTYSADWGSIRSELATDILNKSKATIVDVAYRYAWQTNNIYIQPGIGMQWQSANHNKYYYGITADESARSGLAQYKPSSGIAPYLSLYGQYSFNKNWSAFFMGRYTRISNEAKDSPMVENSYSALFGGGVIYSF